ncbi:hypothetical protein F5884DRAFT_855211 [Xylogone sp. PMI_703]|nr:hypothetical protein F5884DRAFT_855211 [Xylogone sp. PMI_703]
MNAVQLQRIRPIGLSLRAASLPQSVSMLNTMGLRQTSIQRTYATIIRSTRKQPTSFTFSFTSSDPLKRTIQPSTILGRLRNSFRRPFHNSRMRLNEAQAQASQKTAEPQSLGARMKKLSREYGWSALGVYLALTALDLPLCFLLVRHLGTEKIGEWEHTIVSHAKRFIPESVKEKWREWKGAREGDKEEAGHGLEEAEMMSKKDASLATQLALAYAVHKSFIFIRVPITAAITPKVVRVLRGWGWDIGKRTTAEAKAINRAANAASKSKKTN